MIRQTLLVAAIGILTSGTGCSNEKRIESGEGQKHSEGLPTKRKFDFTAYGKTLWTENFGSTSIGDFPKGWNTNAGGEVVEIREGGHALLLTKDGLYLPINAVLPEVFTLEFTLTSKANYSFYSSPLQIMFAALSSKKEYTVLKQYNPHTKDLVKLMLHPMNAASNAGTSVVELYEKGVKQSENEVGTSEFFASGGPSTVRVSIWRQKERLRVYLNKEKLWDLPQAFSAGIKYNSLVFGLSHLVDKTGKYYLSDIRLATEETSNAKPSK